jgi:hypothetical protein
VSHVASSFTPVSAALQQNFTPDKLNAEDPRPCSADSLFASSGFGIPLDWAHPLL